MVNISTYQLHLFLVAAETLNFTQTAQRLEVTQPSVSQNIQSLEEHFGVDLFLRSGRTVELTDAGQALVPLAREIVYLTVQAEEMMASLKGDIHGHLVVGCSTPTSRYLLPKLLATIHESHPNVRATCKVVSQNTVQQLLQEGSIQLAMVGDPISAQDIEFRAFTSDEIILIAPREHPFCLRNEIDIADLLAADFILPVEGHDTHSAIRQALAEHDISIYDLNTLAFLGSLEAIALCVHEGLGVGFIPKLLATRLVKDKVISITVKGLDISREIYVGRNTRRPASAAQTAFWKTLFEMEKESYYTLELPTEMQGP